MNAEPILEPDEILRRAVLEKFADSSLINIKHLHVGVSAKVVHLAGEAISFADWKNAITISASIPMVRGCVNRIETPCLPRSTRIVNFDRNNVKDSNEYEEI